MKKQIEETNTNTGNVVTTCWCGSTKLNFFSESYLKCQICNTLIKSPRQSDDFFDVKDDESDLYGKNYWLEYLSDHFGYPDIFKRARNDLGERCIYWLDNILKYKLPPAKTLELGSGHGGLVGLMKSIGFDATGTELSNWVVNFARDAFDISVLQGKIEDLKLEPESLDCIIMMDVLEHFTDPVRSMGVVSKALKSDGVLIIQTPCYRDVDKTFEQMKSEENVFLQQMKAQEHLYLFSQKGLQLLSSRFGFNNYCWEQPLFEYDMFFIASKSDIIKNSQTEIDELLNTSRSGRIVQALSDVHNRARDLEVRLRESDLDRTARLDVINRLEKQLQKSEADRTARLDVINRLEKQLQESEADRAARLEVINNLNEKLNSVELDRLNLRNNIEELNKQLEDLKAKELKQSQEIDRNLTEIAALVEKLKIYEDETGLTLKGKIIKLVKKL